MKNMKNTARKLDGVLKVLQACAGYAAILGLIFAALLGASWAFDLELITGAGFNELDFGALSLELTEAATPAPRAVNGIMACLLLLSAGALALMVAMLKTGRAILAPMTEGLPFNGEAAGSLKKMALLTLVGGVLTNLFDILEQLLAVRVYKLPQLLIGEAVRSVTVHYQLDLSCLVSAAILLLLAYVFRYGADLQQQADETL